MNRLLLITCCMVLLLCGNVHCKLFKFCSSPHGKIQSVSVSGCKDTDSTCLLKKGTSASITINFTPNYKASSAQVKITGTIGGIPLPFPVSPSEACSNYGLTCPLNTDQVSTFQLELPIKSLYPTTPVDITIQLVDDSKAILACLKFSAEIKS